MVLLIRSLRAKLPNVPIVIAALPPVGHFPALPGLVRRGLGVLVNLHGIALRRLPFRFSKVFFPGGPLRASTWINNSTDLKDFFSDGIHPSALAYRLWAEDTLRFMVRKGVV
jgi:hypothetical protein